AFLFRLDYMRWIVDNLLRQKQRDDADWNIDKEDPMPIEVFSDPSSQGRTDCRRYNNGHAVDREAHIALLGCKCVGEDRLFTRPETSASKALHYTKNNQHRKAGGQSAEHRTQGEQNH